MAEPKWCINSMDDSTSRVQGIFCDSIDKINSQSSAEIFADTCAVSDVTYNSATVGVRNISGTIDQKGVLFANYPDAPGLGSCICHCYSDTSNISDQSWNVEGLISSHHYNVRAYACRNAEDIDYGNTLGFITSYQSLSVNTCEPTNKCYTCFSSGGHSISGVIDQKGFCIALYPNDPNVNPMASVYINTSSTASFTLGIDGLVPDNCYNIRAYVCKSGVEKAFGELKYVDLPCITAETYTPSGITATDATIGVEDITTEGGTIDKKGVLIANYPTTPEIGNCIVHCYEDTAATVDKTWCATSLTPNVHYNVRAYACDSGQDFDYGSTLDFTTLSTGSGTWSAGGTLHASRSGLGGAGTTPLSFGGENGNPLSSTECYRWTTHAWGTRGNLNVARYMMGGSGVTSEYLSFGGYNGSSNFATTEKTSNAGTTWSTRDNLNTARRLLGGAGNTSSTLAVGGYNGSYLSSTEEFHGSSWSTGGSLNIAKLGLEVMGNAGAAIATGGRYTSSYSNTTEKYNGSNWSSVANLNTARAYLAGHSLGSNCYLVFGGYNGSVLANTEEYNCVSDVWGTQGGLLTVRQKVGGAKCLAFGGSGSTGLPLSSTEEYIP